MAYSNTNDSILVELAKCMSKIHQQMIHTIRNLSKINDINAGQWFLECWILARWILEYALISNYYNSLSKKAIESHKLKVKVVFDRVLNEKFSEVGLKSDQLESFVSSAIETYTKIVAEQGFPECLPIIGDVCISGIYKIDDDKVFKSFLTSNKPQVDRFVIELLDHIENAEGLWKSFVKT